MHYNSYNIHNSGHTNYPFIMRSIYTVEAHKLVINMIYVGYSTTYNLSND